MLLSEHFTLYSFILALNQKMLLTKRHHALLNHEIGHTTHATCTSLYVGFVRIRGILLTKYFCPIF